MDKKKAMTLSLIRAKVEVRPPLPKKPEPPKRSFFSRLWLTTAILLLVGIIVVSIVSLNAGSWLKGVHVPDMNGQTPTPIPVTTLPVQRTAPYAGIDVTVGNAQYALAFPDDDIRQGQATVRLNVRISNHTPDQINLVYYDIARLLVPNTPALIPSNVHLSVGPKPGATENGWLDFSLPNKAAQLNALILQLGSTTLGETLVKIPFTGPFDATHFAAHASPQTTTIAYTFFGHSLTYQLKSVEKRFAHKGVQCKAGQQFYVLNFAVDNPEGGDISPGYGFDYIRLVSPGNERTPIDNTLPYTFKANAKGVSGSVVFSAPSGLNKLTIGLLSQNGNGELDTDINI